MGHECFQRDDAKTADSLSFSGLFWRGCFDCLFYRGCFVFLLFFSSYLAFWAHPFYCNSSWIGTFERCILVWKEYGSTIRRKMLSFMPVSRCSSVPR
jgi:hypothetical protein